MNKSELVDFVAQAAGLTKSDSEKAVNAVFQGISNTLSSGNDARFVGFGTFSASKRAARQGRNPRTGETINIPASVVARFKAGSELKNQMN